MHNAALRGRCDSTMVWYTVIHGCLVCAVKVKQAASLACLLAMLARLCCWPRKPTTGVWQETSVRCLAERQIHEWARPLAIDFDWSSFYALLYARTGWRDVFFLAHTGIVCGNNHARDEHGDGSDDSDAKVESGQPLPVLADPYNFGPRAPAAAREREARDVDGGKGGRLIEQEL